MSKKKKIIITVVAISLSVIIAVSVGVGVAVNQRKKEANNNTTTTEYSTITTTAFTTQYTPISTATETTETTTTTTTTTTMRSNENDYINGGYWYYYDKKNTICYAFSFEGNGIARVAYFDSSNIQGEDPQYYTGETKYSVSDKKITVSNLPNEMGVNSVKLEIKNGSIYYKDTELEHYVDLRLDYPVNALS